MERLVTERLKGDNTQRFSRWAVSFREGACSDIATRIRHRRQIILSQEAKKQQAEVERRSENASSSTVLTLATYIDQETDGNNDFLYGEGWSANRAAMRARHAAELREEEEAAVRWAEENPEEAKRESEKIRTQERAREKRRSAYRPSSGSSSGGSDRKDWGAFRAGCEAGASVSIELQTEGTNVRGRLS